MKFNLERKYLTSRDYYNVKVVNDIIYNENTHIVSVFKDYLIYDDVSEFMKRFYDEEESITRLPKVIEFYEKYSKVFPNYVNLPENNYMFKNIERKQRYWDSRQEFIMDQEEKEKERKDKRMKRNGGILGSNRVRGGSFNIMDHSIENRLFSKSFLDDVENIEYVEGDQSSIYGYVNVVEDNGDPTSSAKKSM